MDKANMVENMKANPENQTEAKKNSKKP